MKIYHSPGSCLATAPYRRHFLSFGPTLSLQLAQSIPCFPKEENLLLPWALCSQRSVRGQVLRIKYYMIFFYVAWNLNLIRPGLYSNSFPCSPVPVGKTKNFNPRYGPPGLAFAGAATASFLKISTRLQPARQTSLAWGVTDGPFGEEWSELIYIFKNFLPSPCMEQQWWKNSQTVWRVSSKPSWDKAGLQFPRRLENK